MQTWRTILGASVRPANGSAERSIPFRVRGGVSFRTRRRADSALRLVRPDGEPQLSAPARDLVTCSYMNELPSVAVTQQFLRLCAAYGSQHLVVKLVAVGRDTGVAGLPESDDWTTWDAHEMRAAVEYLRYKRGER